ncbi:Cytochrome c, mono-and diheme variants [Salinihabitans flavidus]|uniref:Cytochrome c, mono-and diheme variants n=1 Tax=Salinihabitans flavidus TaxID=569882 RepID=A0A1H8VSD9_9RHOB|nr:cytochrome c [Salinihabitans flavidus]SEP18224.1 Cytochrome c, mono-and diheme variants [Salinihabitans flavidus]
MRLGFAAVGLIAAGGAAVAVWPVGQPVEMAELEGNVERGAYLARAGGCIACHSDAASGRAPLSGGAPIVSGFGTFVPPNLTTDPDHGIGDWRIEDFAKAVRQGLSPEGALYYPAFPYAFYGHLNDQDIADLWAAFQTVPPVADPAPPNNVSFPVNQRFGLKLWRAAFLNAPPTKARRDKPEAWNRGRWLVNGLAHCGACHTDRNLLGARRMAARFAGSDDLPGGKTAPAITPEALSRNGWTVDNLAFALKSGVAPDGDVLGGGMGDVVQQSTAWMNQEDRKAMATYLLDAAGD